MNITKRMRRVGLGVLIGAGFVVALASTNAAMASISIGTPFPTSTWSLGTPTGTEWPPTAKPTKTWPTNKTTKPPVGAKPPTVPTQTSTAKPPTSSITVTGTTNVLKASCVLLKANENGNEYLLMGVSQNSFPTGTRVKVTGFAHPEITSTCGRGTPLQVSQISKA